MTLRISPAWYRTLALAVAFALVLTSVPAPALVWASASAPLPSQNSTRHAVASSQLNDLVYEIPPSIGQVLEAWQPSDRAPTGVVIHIQDVHADPQVQRHMSDLLGYLHQRLGVQRVAIEGAAGECATDLYASLPHPPTTERLARLFRDEGLFTGAEYYAITHPHDISLWGVEDEAVYLDHLEAYQETLESSATAGILLDRLRDDLARLRSLIFPRAFQSLLALREAYLKNEVRAFQPYVRELLRLARASSLDLTPYPHLQILDRADQLHRRIDMRQVRKDSDRLAATLKPRLTTAQQQEWRQATKAFAAQQVSPERYYEFVAARAAATGVKPFSAAPSTSEPLHHGTWSEFLLEAAIPRGAYPALRQYLTYLHLLRRFSSLEVAKEVDALLEAVCEAHAATESQRSVDRLLKRVEILDGLVHLKLSPEQYRRYQEEREAMSATVLEASLRRLEVKPPLTLDPRLKSLLEHRATWEAFYALAVKRDEALARNTSAQLEAHEDQPLVLITGGFHSPGILQYLKTHAIAYFVVAPKTTEPIDETRYRARLHGHVPSVTELLQKLNQETLSPTSATWLTAQQLRRTKGQPPEPNASQRRQKKSKTAQEDKCFAPFFFTDVILLSRDVPDWQLQLQQWKAHHAADADAFGIDLKVDRTTGRMTVIALGQNVQLDTTTGRLVSAAPTQSVTESASTEERGSVERQPQPKMPIIGRKFSSVAHAIGVSSRSTLLKTISKFPAALLLGSLLLLGQPSPAASQEVIVQPPNVDVVLSSVRVYRLHTNIAPSDSTFLSKLRYVKTHDGRELLTDADFTFSETDRASVLKLLAEKIPQLPENLRGVAEQALEKLRQFHPPTLPTRRPSTPAPQRQNGETGTVMPPPVFGSLQEIADRLPGLILQELAAHGISSEAQIAAQDLLELTRELYTRMGLLDRHYHHHVHNLAVTYAALVLGARTGRIQSARDAKLLFLGALWHDFHLRDAIGQRDGQILGTLASVEETLRQLHDALGLPMVTGPPQEKRYAELIGPVRDMLRHASELWFAPDTLPDYAAELDALIRRTDFPSDVGPAPAAFAEQATRIRTAVSNWVAGTIAADAVDDVIRTTRTALGEVQPTLTPAQITAAERVIRIEAAYFHALQQVSEDRRLSIHQLAELLEHGADQTGLLWLTNPEMFERDILAGLQQELPFVSAEGNYEGFLKPRVLTPETLHLLRDLPEPSRHNFLAMIRHFAERGGPSAFEDWRARETQVRAMLGIEPSERGAAMPQTPKGGEGGMVRSGMWLSPLRSWAAQARFWTPLAVLLGGAGLFVTRSITESAIVRAPSQPVADVAAPAIFSQEVVRQHVMDRRRRILEDIRTAAADGTITLAEAQSLEQSVTRQIEQLANSLNAPGLRAEELRTLWDQIDQLWSDVSALLNQRTPTVAPQINLARLPPALKASEAGTARQEIARLEKELDARFPDGFGFQVYSLLHHFLPLEVNPGVITIHTAKALHREDGLWSDEVYLAFLKAALRPLSPNHLLDLRREFEEANADEQERYIHLLSRQFWIDMTDLTSNVRHPSEPLRYPFVDRQHTLQTIAVIPTDRTRPRVWALVPSITSDNYVHFVMEDSGALRIQAFVHAAGGKGTNTLRALNQWGQPVHLIARGKQRIAHGIRFNELMTWAGFQPEDLSIVTSAGKQRRSFLLTDDHGLDIRLSSPEPRITQAALTRLGKLADEQLAGAARGDWFHIGGTFPPGTSAEWIAERIQAAKAHHMRVLFDFSLNQTADQLIAALSRLGDQDLIKPNLVEFAKLHLIADAASSGLDNEALNQRAEREAEAYRGNMRRLERDTRRMREHWGIGAIVISLDQDGAVWVSKKESLFAQSAQLGMDRAGVGDAFVAGLIFALSSNQFKTSAEVLKFAMQAGVATSQTLPGLFPSLAEVKAAASVVSMQDFSEAGAVTSQPPMGHDAGTARQRSSTAPASVPISDYSPESGFIRQTVPVIPRERGKGGPKPLTSEVEEKVRGTRKSVQSN